MHRMSTIVSPLLAIGALWLWRASAVASDLVLETSWGSHGSGPGQFDHPSALDVGPDGSLYVVDRFNYRVQRFSGDGSALGQWGSWAPEGPFQEPFGIAVSGAGEVFVTDQDVIRVFSEDGSPLRVLSDPRFTPGSGRLFFGVTVLDDARLLVCEVESREVIELTQSGEFVASFGEPGTGPGQFDLPVDVDVNSGGEIFVLEHFNHRVQVFSASHEYVREWDVWVNPEVLFSNPISIAVHGSDVFVTDITWLLRFDQTGNLTGSWGMLGTEPAYGFGPLIGVGTSQEGRVFVGDLNGEIHRFGPAPVQTTTTTWGRLKARHR